MHKKFIVIDILTLSERKMCHLAVWQVTGNWLAALNISVECWNFRSSWRCHWRLLSWLVTSCRPVQIYKRTLRHNK